MMIPMPHPDDNLTEFIEVRCFPGTKARIEEKIKRYPDRWDSVSSYVRAAIVRQDREVEFEERRSALRKGKVRLA